MFGMSLSKAAAQSPSRAFESREYAVAAGPLGEALIWFARQAGIDIAYDIAVVGAAQSPGVHGRYTTREGLRILLGNSGLEAVALADGGYAIRRKAALPPATVHLPQVTVTGTALPVVPALTTTNEVGAAAHLGLLGYVEAMDAPVSTASYMARNIQDLQARSVADVLESDASVRSVSMPGGILDAFTIRGFPYSNGNFGEIAFDGVYGVASNYRVSTGYLERIELIKGPTAPLSGMAPGGSVGGSINIVPKRAPDEDLSQVSADYASESQLGGNIDLSRRLGPQGAFGARFNGGYRTGDTALDGQSRHAGVGALALDYRGPRLHATLDLVGQYESIAAPSRMLHIVPGIRVPAAPDGHLNIAQPWESSRINDQSVLLQAAYDASNSLQAYVHAGGGRTDVARLFAITPTIVNESGDVSVFDTNYRFGVSRASAEAGVRASFSTGPIGHRFGLAFTGYRDQLNRALVNSAITSLTNIYAPVSLPPQFIPPPAAVLKVSQTVLSGVALVDTLVAWDQSVQLTLGLRYQRIASDDFGPDGATTSRYRKSAVTPMLGLVVKPDDHVAIYANRVEGLSKGGSAPASASNAGEVFAPYRSTQYDLGARLQRASMLATVSAFQISRPLGEMSGSLFTVNGEQRNRGIELGLYGDLAPRVRLNASAMWLDATVTRNPDIRDKRPIGVPSWQANVGVEYDVAWMPGVTLTGAVAYNGPQFVDASNAQRIGSWARLDLGFRFEGKIGRQPTTLRFVTRNVLNHRGWSAVDAYGGIAVAEPRAILASVSLSF